MGRRKTPHYKIKFFDKNGSKTGELTNETHQRFINKFDFELNETGCGAFNLILTKLPDFDILRNDIIEIYLMNTATVWYSGYIQKIPEAGRTEQIYLYSGYGFIAELDTIIANKSYTTTELSAAATDLLDTYITPKTRIKKNIAKIEVTTYTAAELNFEYTKIKKAISDLEEAAQTWVAGVDEAKEFFFKARIDTVQVAAVKAIEKHISSFLPKEDTGGIVNKYYIKSGATTGGSNFIGIVEDAVSQALYGLREDVITIPTTNNATDAAQWATGILNKSKDPKISVSIPDIDITFLGEKIEAKGKARILLKAG
jgi:hypothetical protein